MCQLSKCLVQFPVSLGFSIPSFKSWIIVGAVFAVLDFQIRFQWLQYIPSLSVVLQWGQRFFSLLWTWLPLISVFVDWMVEILGFFPCILPKILSTAPKQEGIRLASFFSSLLDHQLLHDTFFLQATQPLLHIFWIPDKFWKVPHAGHTQIHEMWVCLSLDPDIKQETSQMTAMHKQDLESLKAFCYVYCSSLSS